MCTWWWAIKRWSTQKLLEMRPGRKDFGGDSSCRCRKRCRKRCQHRVLWATWPTLVSTYRVRATSFLEDSLWRPVSRFERCSTAESVSSGTPVAIWTGLALRRTGGECIGVYEGRRLALTMSWKLQCPTMKGQRTRRLRHRVNVSN
jgi:hypothetical protein